MAAARKRCIKCGLLKRATSFRLRRDKPGTRRTECVACEGIARQARDRRPSRKALIAAYALDREMLLGLLEDGAALYREALRRVAHLEGRES